jgi:hypothetical protein
MIDAKGIDGTVDYYIAKVTANVTYGTEVHRDETTLKEQLRPKLVAEKSPVSFFVIDHVEHPSVN